MLSPFPTDFPLTVYGGIMVADLELYETLKKTLDEDAARMLVERLPTGQELATKADIERLEQLIKVSIAEFEARFFRWTLGFFIPLWVAVLGALVTLIVLVVRM
jgi:hypothetical protein